MYIYIYVYISIYLFMSCCIPVTPLAGVETNCLTADRQTNKQAHRQTKQIGR